MLVVLINTYFNKENWANINSIKSQTIFFLGLDAGFVISQEDGK